jgi:hypothetical protein
MMLRRADSGWPAATTTRRSSRFAAALGALAMVLSIAAALPIHAQDRSTVVRVLRESRDFRARTRAALALGSSADPAMVGPLVGALSDREAAVRVAAAAGLGRLANPEALPALRRALGDRSREVRDAAERSVRTLSAIAPQAARPARPPHEALPMPSIETLPRDGQVDWRSVRYVIVVGDLQNRAGWGAERMQTVLQREVQRHLLVLRGVVALPDGPHPDADREIARRHLPRLRLEGQIARIQRQTSGRDLQVRCEVALMLMDDPGHNLRAALNGAATGSERATPAARAAQETRLAEQALAGAVRSAMAGAGRAITGSAAAR